MTLYTPLLWQYIVHARVMLCIYQHTKCEVPSFTDSKEMIGGNIKKTGHVIMTTPIKV